MLPWMFLQTCRRSCVSAGLLIPVQDPSSIARPADESNVIAVDWGDTYYVRHRRCNVSRDRCKRYMNRWEAGTAGNGTQLPKRASMRRIMEIMVNQACGLASAKTNLSMPSSRPDSCLAADMDSSATSPRE